MSGRDRLPPGPWLAWYGDDFTGSTDVMEAFGRAGVETVLFLQPPAPDALQRFPNACAVGLAGTARSRSPAWMDAELPAAFDALARLGAPLLQYKVCSTFDSSPAIGSIGHAIDLGVARMGGRWVPMVVGAPRLQRYQLFGHLFAAVGGQGHRLDRHPTMSRHPVTPMTEADLTRHLAAQTARRIALIDAPALKAGRGAERVAALQGADTPVLAIDVLDDETLAAAGALVWQQRGDGLFCAASSGLQDALAAHWCAQGWLPPPVPLPDAPALAQIAVVSGSCSPVTAAQIAWARARGFATERLQVAPLLGDNAEAEIARAVDAAAAAAAWGASPLVYSAEGPDDASVLGFDALCRHAGLAREEASRRVGRALAEVLARLLARVPLARVAVAGGDSSGEVTQRLGLDALTLAAGLAPGAPLCQGWREGRAVLQLVLKGGQMGREDFFGQVRAGRVAP
ncbi:MAG: 3-oxo-isoapionate kinase OiaK [Rubrivivax sp.]